MNENSRPWRRSAVTALVPLAIVAAVVWSRSGAPPAHDDNGIESSVLSPVDVLADEPAFSSVSALAQASDLVIVGTVTADGPGRSISDPTDPETGIRTTVFEVRVDEVLRGEAGATITVEHETTLIDGTPITINGTPPPRRGEEAVFFLIAGEGGDFPHYAVNTSAGRIPVTEFEDRVRDEDGP